MAVPGHRPPREQVFGDAVAGAPPASPEAEQHDITERADQDNPVGGSHDKDGPGECMGAAESSRRQGAARATGSARESGGGGAARLRTKELA